MSEATSGSPGGEQWLPVVGYEGMYEVSDQGRVRSLDRVDAIGRPRRGSIMKQSRSGQKHWMVGLTKDCKQKMLPVHRLMAVAFLGPEPFKGALVRHLDDDVHNNTIENLAWGTVSENQLDAVRNGRNFWRSRTHCKRGHSYETAGVTSGARGWRRCRACESATERIRARPYMTSLRDEIADAYYRKILTGDQTRVSTPALLEEYGRQ